MIGIFLKDFLLKWKSIVIFLAVVIGLCFVCYSVVKSAGIPDYIDELGHLRAILYCLILIIPSAIIFSAKSFSVSTMKADRVAQWDKYLETMPVSRWMTVLSKYALWIGVILCGCAVTGIVKLFLVSSVGDGLFHTPLITPDLNSLDSMMFSSELVSIDEMMAVVWFLAAVFVLVGAVSMTLTHYFGPKSSKLWSLLATIVIFIPEVLPMFLSDGSLGDGGGVVSYFWNLASSGQYLLLFAIICLIFVISYVLSVLLLSRKSY